MDDSVLSASEGKVDGLRAYNSKPKVYALLVGINDYQRDVNVHGLSFAPLNGCVSDVQKIAAYLNADEAVDVQVLLLLNQSATKNEIVKAFSDFLGKASANDSVLFYFSGHGAQEWADPAIWKMETDRQLECIACYDFLLADKELRFLLHKLSASCNHIVTLFDCCHSADNTRNATPHTIPAGALKKSIPGFFPVRAYPQFIFSDTISMESLKNGNEARLLPEGKYIQFAACDSYETAVELNGAGVFTEALLNALQTATGNLTYYELRNRIRQSLRTVYKQNPAIYWPPQADGIQYMGFLNRAYTPFVSHGEIVYNAIEGWQLNYGAVQGIDAATKLIVIDEVSGQPVTEAQPVAIRIDTADVEPAKELNKNIPYKVLLEGLWRESLPVYAENAADKITAAGISFTNNEAESRYVIRNRDSQLFITYPFDAGRPLVRQVSIEDPQALQIIIAYLQHIAQWECLKNLENQNLQSQINTDSLMVKVVQVLSNGIEKYSASSNGEVVIPFEKINNQWKTAIKVTLTNTTPQHLYCAALYLTIDFRSFTRFLSPAVYLLPPGETVALHIEGDPLIEVAPEEVYCRYNWPSWEEQLQFIFSTHPFDVDVLEMEALPLPVIHRSGDDRSGEAERGLNTSRTKKRLSGWNTKQVNLFFPNPVYDHNRE
jgi:hypothetical protein